MSRYVMPLAAVLVLCLVVPTMAAEPQLAHMVYFKLKDSSDASKEKLVAACQEYLSDHEGTVYFSAGVIAKDLDREVNDKDFDVALHLVFRDKAAHDKYSTHERHVKFIEKCQEGWAKVRVFDSYIAASR
ncbi:MAG: Dabb family protein [Pirellulaceae bacterium]